MVSSTGVPHHHTKDDATNLVKLVGRAVEDLRSQRGRVFANLNLARTLGSSLISNGVVDDRKYLNESIVQLAASLPNDSGLRNDLSGTFIKTLWNNLSHPPLSYLGEPYKYRTADGSHNNIMYPRLGASGSHYARSVTSSHLRSTVMPDPGLIYDVLLKREGVAKEHPAGVSSSLFHFATIIIHDLFHTDEKDSTKVKSSSYLDLGVLYGHNQSQQKTVRTFQDGHLKKDAFAEYRLLGQPPGVAALMVSFNRFHNYVVDELAAINEHGRFSLPAGMTPDSKGYSEAKLKRDNDLFQTGRLITCGLYVNIILGDYLRTILNLNGNPTDSDWKLDPREAFTSVFDAEGTPKGIGNQVSAEFNFIYRWHAGISNADEAWMNEFFAELFPGVDSDTLQPEQLTAGMAEWFQKTVPRDPGQWTFGKLQRQEDGSFADADLVEILTASTDNIAGAFGARNIPAALRAVEIMGIKQGREWGMASLNEFRSFFKLKPFTSFRQMNSQPGIAEALEALYGHPDNIELYPGLMAEEAKVPLAPGSGLCPGFTISETILADAVTLVRGDRFYSVEYGPQSLTSFGFNEVASDFEVASGGLMYKLLMRAFPAWYDASSVYALYPFTTPAKTKSILNKIGRTPNNIELNYSVPSLKPTPVAVKTWQGVVDLLNDQAQFKVPWGDHIHQLTGHEFVLSGDKPSNSKQKLELQEAMYRPQDTLDQVRKFYERTTSELISKHKLNMGTIDQIDIVQDIGNLAHTVFTAKFFGIPIRESIFHFGPGFTPKQLYDILSDGYEYVFLDMDPANSYKHRVVTSRELKDLANVVRRSVEAAQRGPGFIGRLLQGSGGHDLAFGGDFVKRLLEGGKPVEDVVWEIITTGAAATATQAQAWAQMIDVYMSPKYSAHWADITRLAQSDAPEDFEKLKKYTLEGFRLFPGASGVLRVSPGPTTIMDGDRVVAVPAGQRLFADFGAAGMDPVKYPEPEQVRLDRAEDSYIYFGWAPHACLGRPIAITAATAMLRTFARECQGVKNSPGPAGEMQRKMVDDSVPMYLSEDGASWKSFPVAKKVIFNA